MPKYSINEIKQKVDSAFQSLCENGLDLLQINVNEPTVSGELKGYLELEFPDWHVNCEYNRHGEDTKKIANPNVTVDGKEYKNVFPDVIIHRRKTDSHNILVIELKKAENKDKEQIAKDRATLAALTSDPYLYDFGLHLIYGIDGTKKDVWFRAGVETTLEALGYAE